MNKTLNIIGATVLMVTIAVGCTAEEAVVKLDDAKQRISYTIGLNIGRDFSSQEIEVDTAALMAGVRDGLGKEKPRLTDEQMLAEVKTFREAMVAKQQELGKDGNIVAEGRDTTTVVFPNAHLKIYLDASLECRAQRRLLDLVKMGIETSLEEQESDLRRRDSFDSGRQHSPLRRAEDAHMIDTTILTIDEQVDRIVALLKAAAKAK